MRSASRPATHGCNEKCREIDRGRIDGALQQALEQDEHGRDRHAGEELDEQEADVGAGRFLALARAATRSLTAGPASRPIAAAPVTPPSSSSAAGRRTLPGCQRERAAEGDAAGGEQRERDGRRPHELARRFRCGPAIERRTDQQQDRDPERPRARPPRPAAATRAAPRSISSRRDRDFHQRLAARGAQEKRVRARRRRPAPSYRVRSDAGPSGVGELEVARRDRRRDGRRGEPVLDRNRAEATPVRAAQSAGRAPGAARGATG